MIGDRKEFADLKANKLVVAPRQKKWCAYCGKPLRASDVPPAAGSTLRATQGDETLADKWKALQT